jgi:hypothetical protein
MGKEPDEIREEIEETRSQMGETIEAIGYRADVKARVKESVAEKKDAVTSAVAGAKDSVVSAMTGSAGTVASAVSDTLPSGDAVKRGARRGAGMARENPIGLAVGSAAIGFLAGLLIPSTRVEDERLGELGDQVREAAKETGQEALERGKTVAQEVVESAQETVRESGQQQGQELADSLRESAQEVASGGSAGASDASTT